MDDFSSTANLLVLLFFLSLSLFSSLFVSFFCPFDAGLNCGLRGASGLSLLLLLLPVPGKRRKKDFFPVDPPDISVFLGSDRIEPFSPKVVTAVVGTKKKEKKLRV